MFSEKMNAAISEQINAEIFSGYLYLAMAAWFAEKGLGGCENWMKIQAQEELSHAMKFFNHVYERGGKVEIKAIAKPDTEWTSPLSVFEATLKHEQHVTSLINDLMTLSIEERDYASQNFLQWYIAEQVEEETTAEEIRSKFELAGDSKPALLMLDKELGTRVFTYPPTALSGE